MDISNRRYFKHASNTLITNEAPRPAGAESRLLSFFLRQCVSARRWLEGGIMFRQNNLAVVITMCWAVAGFLPADATAIPMTTGLTGGGQAQTTIQPSLALNPLIRITGNFDTLGEVVLFGGNFAPRGWAEANGQVLQIADHTALYAQLGTRYGGDGRTTFALPDLRGRTAIGDGAGPGLTPRTLGQKVGVESVSLTPDNLPAHDHGLPAGGSTDMTGGGQSYTNMQASLGLNYMVPLTGLFPGHGDTSIEPTLGFVELFTSNPFDLRGYVSADGQLLQISQNEALFSLLGTIYGGDGRTTFGLPDLRGRAAIGAGSGPDLSEQRLGQKGGVESVSMSAANMPGHNHTLPPSSDVTGNTGGGQPQTNMQPTLALQYLVAINGAYPDGDPDIGPILGEIALFAGHFVPRGWAVADGQLLEIIQNEALFSLFGSIYGGNGRTTFGLPDLRGRLALGDGRGVGLLTDWRLGQSSGVESLAMSVAQMPTHRHTYPAVIESAVPEPATLILLGLGLAGIGISRKRKRY